MSGGQANGHDIHARLRERGIRSVIGGVHLVIILDRVALIKLFLHDLP